MNEPIKKYMKPGIVHFMAYPQTMKGSGPILDTVKRIASDDYFDAIEIAWINDKYEREKVRDCLVQSKIDVCYGASPRLLTTGLNVNDVDPNGRTRAIDTLKAGIDEAYFMGARGFGLLSGKYQPETKSQAFDALVDSLRELCAYSSEKGNMRILLEIFDYDMDKCSLIGPTQLALRLAQELKGLPNFGLMVDLSHIPLMHESISQAIYPIAKYIKHAHMGNAVIACGEPAFGDAHPRFGFPHSENGVAELTAYLRALMDIGYLNSEEPGIVSFEIKPFGTEDPEMIIAGAKRTLNAAWARL